MASKEKNKEPFLRIAKRDGYPPVKAWIVRIASLLLALVVCGVLIYAITDLNPVAVYKTMFKGAFGTNRRFWVTIRDAMFLLLISVGLAPAFKMKFWNIGAEGQILMGGVATAAIMIYFGSSLPTPLLFLVMILVSVIAGAVWGVIPALFKAQWGTNETLFTLMLNYVAIQITSYCVARWEHPFGSNSVGIINSGTKYGWLPELFGKTYGWNVLIVLLITIGMFVYMNYSKQGYEISVVGESVNTAKYASISVKKTIIRTMIISGGLCGLSGFLAVSGASHTISTSTAGGQGFPAIIVAWLAKFDPLIMILISFMLAFLDKGAIEIASQFNLNDYASQMITGIILFFILGSEFFINYELIFRKKNREVAE
ncbi:MAG: ABC transporter permease [Clostridiales bacterium]|nr:ABC transporter permease [Clostridiales bacterium]